MPFKNKITKSTYLINFELEKLLNITDDLERRCAVCREVITNNNTLEHVYPRWLQKMFNLENQKINLLNGTTYKYKQLVVNCCSYCNSDIMGVNENHIKQAFEGGIDKIKSIDEEYLVWWLQKIFYFTQLKESTLLSNIRDLSSKKIVSQARLNKLNSVYMYMVELLKGFKFMDPKPYELYIFQSEDSRFDYIDDVESNSVYIQINDIILICCFDSFSLFKELYNIELNNIMKLGKVFSIEAVELFTKMSFYRKHFTYSSSFQYLLASDGIKILNEIHGEVKSFKEIDLSDLHNDLTIYIKRINSNLNIPIYEKDTVISFIRNV